MSTLPALPIPGEEVAQVEGGASPVALQLAAWSPNTRRAYRSSWRRWCCWCEEERILPLGADPGALDRWAAALAGEGLRASTVARHVAAVCTAHQLAGLPSPRSGRMGAILRGARRSEARGPVQARPILAHELVELLPPPDDLRGLRDRALLLLGWAGALRRSELAGLLVAHVEQVGEGLVLHLVASKGDRDGAGAVVGIPPGRSPRICPVAAALAWRGEVKPDGALFLGIDRWSNLGSALSPAGVGAIIAERAAAIGIVGVTGHSLRAGWITEASRAGRPEWRIQQHTRHRDVGSLRGYIRVGGALVDHPGAGLL